MPRAPQRIDGYAPIRDYAVISNECSAGLIALDGSIDWLCLPRFDSPSMFAALLDARAGGSFELAPEVSFQAERRYIPDTNVLETVFSTRDGEVCVTDAMTVHTSGPLPWAELVRRVEGRAGSVPMRWAVEPRFDWARTAGAVECRDGVHLMSHDTKTVVVRAWDAGEPTAGEGSLSGRFRVAGGARALLALAVFDDAPLLLSEREDFESRLDETVNWWRRRAAVCSYDGPYREAVLRSALALQSLIYRPTGAIAAAATSSLPETVGGDRNWDYRFCWVRDTAFTLEAMLQLGYEDQVHASLAWLLETTRRTHPQLHVFYRLDGSTYDDVTELDLEGYRGSRPVKAGNRAARQLQLGNYADLMQTAWLYVQDGNMLDARSGRQLAEVADRVVELWRCPDASIWELTRRRQYTQGKLSAWLALDRAAQLAVRGQVPADNAASWRREAGAASAFMEEHCWSDALGSYTQAAGSEDLDASMLLAARVGYLSGDDPRLNGMIDALQRKLGEGALLYRFTGAQEIEGAFLACSFWMVEALARVGRVDEAHETLEELLGSANDVGLFSEQIDPGSGDLLGNFPQALTHLSVVNAAALLSDLDKGRVSDA